MAYVYRHIRLDKYEPFYKGIGNDKNGYKRAFSKKGRSKFWNYLYKKCEIKIEILVSDISWKKACEKEKYFINLYGRRDLKNGTLVNLTEGGEGVLGYRHSKEIINFYKSCIGSRNGNSKKCIHFDSLLEFGSLIEGCKYFNLNKNTERCRIKNKSSKSNFYYKNNPFTRPTKEDVSKRLGEIRIGNKNGIRIKVIHLETGIEYESITLACKILNLNASTERNKMIKNQQNKKFKEKENGSK